MNKLRYLLSFAIDFMRCMRAHIAHTHKYRREKDFTPVIPHDERYLYKRIAPHNHRFTTFKTVLALMEQRNVKIIVETGTSRSGLDDFAGDGGSSIIFSHYTQDHQAQFFSVDINPHALLQSQNAVRCALGGLSPNLHFIQSDSVRFLQEFPNKIDMLYLDSYDFDSNNPAPSQQHHLSEIEAAYPHLTTNSLVMIDDCDLPHGGKGALVIGFLKQRGWKELKNKYQVILVHEL